MAVAPLSIPQSTLQHSKLYPSLEDLLSPKPECSGAIKEMRRAQTYDKEDHDVDEAMDCNETDAAEDGVDGHIVQVNSQQFSQQPPTEILDVVDEGLIRATETPEDDTRVITHEKQSRVRRVLGKVFKGCQQRQLSFTGVSSPLFIYDPDAGEPGAGSDPKVDIGVILLSERGHKYTRHFIHQVEPNSIAEGFGLRERDELLLVNRNQLVNQTHEHVIKVFSSLEVGKDILLIFRRREQDQIRSPNPVVIYIKTVSVVEWQEETEETGDYICKQSAEPLTVTSSRNPGDNIGTLMKIDTRSGPVNVSSYESRDKYLSLRNGRIALNDSFSGSGEYLFHRIGYVDLTRLFLGISPVNVDIFKHENGGNPTFIGVRGRRFALIDKSLDSNGEPDIITDDIAFRPKVLDFSLMTTILQSAKYAGQYWTVSRGRYLKLKHGSSYDIERDDRSKFIVRPPVI